MTELLTPEEHAIFLNQLSDGWRVVENKLEKTFTFDNFAKGLALVNNIGALAETVGHHPDLFLAWGKVNVTIWTHSVGGLTEKDFEFAKSIDSL